jgi:hypothetical protein
LSNIVSPSLEDHVGSSEHLSNSVEWEFRDKIEGSVNVETEFFIQSLGLSFWSFVKINYSPSLSNTVAVFPNSDFLSFSISCRSVKNSFILLEVDELRSRVFEKLPPSRVSTPDLHVIGFSGVLDVPRLVVILGSDGQRLLMEVPNLSVSSIWCLENKLSGVDQIEIFV